MLRNWLHRPYFFVIAAICCVAVGPSFATAKSDASLEKRFQDEFRPILAELCFDCHGPEKQKGDVRFDLLSADVSQSFNPEIWHDALDQLSLGEMPPRKSPQPSAVQRKLLTDWLSDALREAAEAARWADGRVVTRRLTRYEYANTMRDLLGVNLDFARDLPPDPSSSEGFLNNGATLEMSPTQIEVYLEAARKALDEAIVSGERPQLHQFAQEKTAVGNLPTRKVAGHLPARPEFILDLKEFPRSGEFELRIRARASIPDAAGYPKIRVSLGHVPGIIHVPRGEIGEIDVSPESQVFTLSGRMEDFPQPGPISFGRSGFKGMIVMLDFLDADGNELRYPDQPYAATPPKPKKGEKPKTLPEPPPFGSRLDIAIESVEFQAPVLASWPPPSHLALLGPVSSDEEGLESVRDRLERFMTRAYRRPLRPEEVERTLQLYQAIRPTVDSFEAAMRETFASVLVSPHFLYIVENRSLEDADLQPLNDFEIATRLSYFLWSSMPDERLFQLAAQQSLRQPGMLDREVDRMLADPRAEQFAAHFTNQWLDLEALDRVAVNPEFFPDFDNALKEDMRRQTQSVFAEILHSDGRAIDLIDADWTLLNRALAQHYGLPSPRSSRLEYVALKPEDRRGGLLAQGAFLLASSNGEDSHPIKRAVWILDRLLDSPPAPPPPEVPELDPENPDLAGLSLKDQLAVHREKESCRSCHEGIDPWGIPLENFDALGRWRTAPDVSSTLPNGTEIDGFDELKRYLLEERSDWFARSLAKRMMGYALGRSLDLGDRETVETLTRQFVENDFRLKKLIVDLVNSEAFLTK